MQRRRWPAQGLDLLVLGIGLFTTLFLLFVGLADITHATVSREHLVQAATAASRRALYAAAAEPSLATGQATLNAARAAAVFDRVFPEDLQWPAGSYSIQDVQLVTTGETLPGNLDGTATGPGLYVQVQFLLTIFPFGNPSAAATTLPVTVEVETSAARFNQPQAVWVTN